MHVPASIFASMANLILKITDFENTTLYSKLKECLLDVDQSKIKGEDYFLMQNINLLTDLYQFLPSNKSRDTNLSQQM